MHQHPSTLPLCCAAPPRRSQIPSKPRRCVQNQIRRWNFLSLKFPVTDKETGGVTKPQCECGQLVVVVQELSILCTRVTTITEVPVMVRIIPYSLH
jgi:hypothetical protein